MMKARTAVVQCTGVHVRSAQHMTGSCPVTFKLSLNKLVPHGVSLKVSAGFGGSAGGFPRQLIIQSCLKSEVKMKHSQIVKKMEHEVQMFGLMF